MNDEKTGTCIGAGSNQSGGRGAELRAASYYRSITALKRRRAVPI
jgi:hypothetical protein